VDWASSRIIIFISRLVFSNLYNAPSCIGQEKFKSLYTAFNKLFALNDIGNQWHLQVLYIVSGGGGGKNVSENSKQRLRRHNLKELFLTHYNKQRQLLVFFSFAQDPSSWERCGAGVRSWCVYIYIYIYRNEQFSCLVTTWGNFLSSKLDITAKLSARRPV
jgi:hypothetical protein